MISGRSLVNDRTISPNAAFVPTRKFKKATQEDKKQFGRFAFPLSLLGDSFVEAVPDQTLIDLAAQQCKSSHRKIYNQVAEVPIRGSARTDERRQVRLEKPRAPACYRLPATLTSTKWASQTGCESDESNQPLQRSLRSRMTHQDPTASPTLTTSPQTPSSHQSAGARFPARQKRHRVGEGRAKAYLTRSGVQRPATSKH